MRLFIVENYQETTDKYAVIDLLPDPPDIIKTFNNLEEAQDYVEKFYDSKNI
jgi:hypothetical protein